MRASDAIAIVEIKRGVSQVPAAHPLRGGMIARHDMMADGQSGLHFNHAGAAHLDDTGMPTPIADQLHGLPIVLTVGDGLLDVKIVVHATRKCPRENELARLRSP